MKRSFMIPCVRHTEIRVFSDFKGSVCEGCRDFKLCIKAGWNIKGFTFCGIRIADKIEMRYHKKVVLSGEVSSIHLSIEDIKK